MFFQAKICFKQPLIINGITIIKFYKFVLYRNYIELKIFRIRIRPDFMLKNKSGTRSRRIFNLKTKYLDRDENITKIF